MEDTKIAEMSEKTALQAAEEAEKEKVTDSDTRKTLRLSKPFEWEGKTYNELKFDYEKLLGTDMIAIEDEMAAVGQIAISPEVSTSYLSKLAARAAGVGSDMIEHLPIRDFGKIKNMSRDFLLKAGLAD